MDKKHTDAPNIKPSIELVEKLVKFIEKGNTAQKLASGACVYNTPNGPKCAVLTPDQCAVLGGNYVGGKC
jgi:hypothetical protein